MERKLRKKLKGGKFHNVSLERSKTMQAIKGRGNKSTELACRMALVRAGISGWGLHPPDIEGNPDIYFESKKVAVFLDGCFWHGCPKCGHIPKTNSAFWEAKIKRNKQRDRSKRSTLRKQGISVMTLWEHDLKNNLTKCIIKLEKVLNHGK